MIDGLDVGLSEACQLASVTKPVLKTNLETSFKQNVCSPATELDVNTNVRKLFFQ